MAGPFSNFKFDVEHALNIYADSFCTFHAESLYDENFLKAVGKNANRFHIYLIGYAPKIEAINPVEENGVLCMTVKYLGKEYIVKWAIPSQLKFKKDGENACLINEAGEEFWPDQTKVLAKLKEQIGPFEFKVKYVGQSFGNDGSRNAIERLTKHETLQKIAVKGAPADYILQIVLLEILPATRLITVFYPDAKNKDDDGSRRRQGLDKLFGTSEAERISLYEAALIRYFSPEFNKAFKDSFPSTNMKILQDCYAKDFLGLVSEISLEGFPFKLGSEVVKPTLDHVIMNDLQNEADRKMFFSTNR